MLPYFVVLDGMNGGHGFSFAAEGQLGDPREFAFRFFARPAHFLGRDQQSPVRGIAHDSAVTIFLFSDLRVGRPVIGQLNMAQATPLLLLLIALTWLVVWLRDGIEQRRKLARTPQSVVWMLIVLLGSSSVMGQPSWPVAGSP